MFNNFYNGSIRKMVVAFGSLFNQIKIDKTESSGIKQILVPISYASKEKYLTRLTAPITLGAKAQNNTTNPNTIGRMTPEKYIAGHNINKNQNIHCTRNPARLVIIANKNSAHSGVREANIQS